MVSFSRLRLLGFKSFVEPADFHIETGLTGVVGPNGCGKSNLVEALRWVMGESSYKNMRASGMDDVIFSGSGNRPARNTAEVTLVIDNGARTAPAAFNDADILEVTRRIEREAGSEYRINGREVRARDVQLLFADASTGAHSPSMVGQGRVGELIAAKPQARRALLEEAAGVAGLHSRRHEAELRLNAAELNLARLDDVVAEIDVQLDALRRQARQAIRYRNISADIRRAEATVLYLRWVRAAEAVREAEEGLATARSAHAEASSAQAAAARDQAVAAAGLPPLRDRDVAARATLQRLSLAGEALEGEERRVRDRLADLAHRIAQAGDDIAREVRMAAEDAAMLRRLDEEEQALSAEAAGASGRLAEAERALSAAESALADRERLLAEATAGLAELNARRSQHRRAADEASGRARRHAAEREAVARELAALVAASGHEAAIAAGRDAIAAAEAEVATAEATAQAAERDAGAAREAEAAAARAAARAAEALARLEAEAAALAKMLDRGTAVRSPLIDAITVAPGWEAALAAAFGEELDLSDDEAAPAHWRAVAGSADPPLPQAVEALSARVEAPPVLTRCLAQIGLVARADGRRLQSALVPGQSLVSREGDLWRWDGYVAAADAPTAAATRLANRNRLAELRSAIDGLRMEAQARRVAAAAASGAARAAADAERRAREAGRAAQRALDGARQALAEAERQATRAASRIGALREAESRLAAAVAEAEAAAGQANTALAALPEPALLEQRLAELRAAVAADRAAAATLRAERDGLVREASLRQRRQAAIAAERQSWTARAAGAAEQIATLRDRCAAAERERDGLAGEPAAIQLRRAALLTELAAAEAARNAASGALDAAEAAQAATDKAAQAALDGLATAREQRGRAEERVASAEARRAETVERIAEALDATAQDAAALAGLKPGAPLPDLIQMEARAERLRQERERLGAVNLRAEEEAEEIAARRDHLVMERDDLIEAIHRLRQAIGSLNREGRERLLAAFRAVDGHFRKLFTHLFGGGTAELQLTESDDPLEAGLEILARPPGKKPQTMTLLSGGEQALTALALIFAVFLTNPAPICVLDEVDAPLDDANVERFCSLLEEMTRQTDTRFLVVTHNPITMARMNRLFGVTMSERGVSQLVSVDLETAERFREAG